MTPLLGLVLFAGGLGFALVSHRRGRRHLKDRKNSGKREEAAMQDLANVEHHLRLSTMSLVLTGIGLLWPAALVAALPIIGYNTHPFLKRVIGGLRRSELRIEVVDTVGTLLGVATRQYVLSALVTLLYYWALRLLSRSRSRAEEGVIDIFSGHPPEVWLLRDGAEVAVPLTTIQKDDCIAITAGTPIPVDGEIVAGAALIDQHVLTGEARPVEKIVGDKVSASTLVLAGHIVIRLEQSGSDTIGARIAQLLADTDQYLATVENRHEQIANRSVGPTFAISSIAIFTAGPYPMLVAATSNFSNIMRLTMPLTLLNFFRAASKSQLLFKDGRALEQLARVDTVIFDKTGTLTVDQPYVGTIYTCVDFTARQVLSYAAAAEYHMTHPIARAILHAAHQQGIALSRIDDAEYQMGLGIKVKIKDRKVAVGSRRFMRHEQIALEPELERTELVVEKQGHSFVYTSVDGVLCGAIELCPTIRPEAQQVVGALRARGLSVLILSGDRDGPVRDLAATLGVDSFIAQALPEAKAKVVDELQQRGKTVCFVGDGINDSIALRKAAVSISLQNASHLALDTAQIILLDKDLSHLLTAFDLADRLKRNQRWSIGTTIVVPSLACMAGAMFFGMSLAVKMTVFSVSAFSGTVAAYLPLLSSNFRSSPSDRRPRCPTAH
jgi:Cu2+-exporting ATPase